MLSLENISYHPFDLAADPASLGSRWEKWLRGFKRFAIAKGIKDDFQKKNLLLVCAGPEVQDLYDGLHPDDDVDEVRLTQTGGSSQELPSKFQEAVDILSSHFVPQVNVPFERHLFKQMSPEVGENVSKFIARLKTRAKNCSFSDIDDQIRDQVIHTVKSSKLRRKLLENGKNLTLSRLQEIAVSFEAVENQMAAMSVSEVNKVSYHKNYGEANYFARPSTSSRESNQNRPNTKFPYENHDKQCYRCGFTGHFGKDKCCPANGKSCNKCKGKNHFASVCKTKNRPTSTSNFSKQTKRSVSLVQHTGLGEEQDQALFCNNLVKPNYAFSVLSDVSHFNVDTVDGNVSHIKIDNVNGDISHINIELGGIMVNMMIDSGASANVIDEDLWNYLKRKGINCVSTKEWVSHFIDMAQQNL